MKKGYMLAPNGEPTKLSEDLWLIVRTSNFKRWFGDWETLAEYEFLNGKSIRDISTKSVPSGGFAAIREWAAKIFESQGGVAKNSILGDVILDKASVRDSLAHGGANLYKSAAFEVAKDVIEKGYLIFNDVNKGRDSYYFAAPINIDGVPNIVVALVHKYDNDNRFYLHSVGTKESLLGNRVSGLSKDKSSNTSTTYPRDYLQALQNIFNVKPEDVSKVVDENGEPLVVYHGTDNTNTDYTNFTVFKHSDPRVKKYVHFFSSNRDVAGSMGSYIYDVFLDIKNPLIIDAGGNDWGAIKDHTNGKVKFSDLTNEQKKKLCKVFDCTMKDLESSYRADSVIDLVQAGVIKRNERSTNEWAEYARANGYDGVIFKNVRDGAGYDAMSAPADVFASFNSNQVKSAIFDSNNAMSATKSVGTFSDSPDIRFSIRDDSQLERIRNLSDGDIKNIMDEAERVVASNLKDSRARSAERMQSDKEKYISDNMPKWEESQDGDYKSYYNPNGYYISEEDGEYHISDSDGNELDWYSDLEYAKREALGLFWETEVYDELDYKEDLYEDNEANSMRKKFEYALGKLGIEITHSTGGTFHGSEYVYLRLPNGEEKKIRFADHRQVYSADMSVEENWRDAFKFFVERVQKEDWTEENYPENIRFRINEDDATSFRRELQDYIDGKLDRRHVFKLGRTPEVMRLVGVDDLPIELAASVLKRKEAKHDLKLEDLMNLPYELANPIAITQSGTSPDAIVVITGLPTANGNPLVVAIHLNQKVRSIEINDIRSIHQRTKYGIQSLVNRGELLYINTKRKPKWLTLPFQIASGRRAVKRAYGHEVFTEADISQEEKESFPKLLAGNDIRELERQERGNNPLVWASIVLAKDVLNGRQITQARLEKLLPGYKLDGSKYEYVKDRAQKIAETCRAKYLNAKRDIDQSLQLAESDYYWTSEQMEKIYDSFRKDGEAYGEAKQKIIAFPQCSKR